MRHVIAVSMVWSFINLALTTCANVEFHEIALKRAENTERELRLYKVRDELRETFKRCKEEGKL